MRSRQYNEEAFLLFVKTMMYTLRRPPQTIYKISFGQLYLSKPMMTESNGEAATLFPKAARLRNLMYSAPLYVDVTKKVTRKEHDGEEVSESQNFKKVFIGKEKDLTELGECPYDQGRYFITNGSEKVLIAQEKMSTNHVYVFKKRQPHKYTYVAEDVKGVRIPSEYGKYITNEGAHLCFVARALYRTAVLMESQIFVLDTPKNLQ
ncbi:hypothetical protein Drorol1_Dr00025392, partial [Drosera rotundifolia]